MTIEEAIKSAEETAIGEDELCKRYDRASGYSRNHDETIRTTDAKRCEKIAQEHRQLAEWLKDYKRLLENSSEIPTISFKEMTDNLKITADDIENAEDLEYSIEPLVHPKNDLGVDCIDRAELLKAMDTWDKFGYTARYGLERLDKDDKGFVPYVKYDDMVNCVKGMPSVKPQKPILDKIRAEIMKLDDINPDYPMDRTIHISRNEVLQIIDKYKAESEDI